MKLKPCIACAILNRRIKTTTPFPAVKSACVHSFEQHVSTRTEEIQAMFQF
jgi:hypothetical protein